MEQTARVSFVQVSIGTGTYIIDAVGAVGIAFTLCTFPPNCGASSLEKDFRLPSPTPSSDA